MPPAPTGSTTRKAPRGLTYASAGVDLEGKDAFTESLTAVMKRTHGPRVIPNPGGFAGLFRLDFNERLFRRNFKDPVLVACADGVGTKLKLAIDLKRYDTLGIDLVAMNVNDMIVQGAEPLFFLDYIAIGTVDRPVLDALVRGMAEGCKRAGCALLGGETAEMSGLYQPGDFDLAGFAVGVMELSRAIKPERVQVGDIVLGLGSDGIHSNGYSLVRRILNEARLDLHRVYPELNDAAAPTGGTRRAARARRSAPAQTRTLGEVLLTPTRIYVEPILKLLKAYRVKRVVGGMAHITGSGLAGNLCRALHPKVDAIIDPAAWEIPPVFRFLQHHGGVSDDEMRRVFNMGIGYCLIVRPAFAESVADALAKMGERVFTIGEIQRGRGEVRLIER